jgi:hypothetical protein
MINGEIMSRLAAVVLCLVMLGTSEVSVGQPKQVSVAFFDLSNELHKEVENLRELAIPADVLRSVTNPYIIWQYQGNNFQALDRAVVQTDELRRMAEQLKRIYFRRDPGNPAFYEQFGSMNQKLTNVFNSVSTLQWTINQTYSANPVDATSAANKEDVVARLNHIEELKWQLLYVEHVMQHQGTWAWTESGVQWMQTVLQNRQQANQIVQQQWQEFLQKLQQEMQQQQQQQQQQLQQQGQNAGQMQAGYGSPQQMQGGFGGQQMNPQMQGGFGGQQMNPQMQQQQQQMQQQLQQLQTRYFAAFFQWIELAQQRYGQQLNSAIFIPDYHPYSAPPRIMPGPKGNVPFCLYEYLSMQGKNPYENGRRQEFGRPYEAESLPFYPPGGNGVPYLPPGARPEGYQVPQGMPAMPALMANSGLPEKGWGPMGSATPPVNIAPTQTVIINTGGSQSVSGTPQVTVTSQPGSIPQKVMPINGSPAVEVPTISGQPVYGPGFPSNLPAGTPFQVTGSTPTISAAVAYPPGTVLPSGQSPTTISSVPVQPTTASPGVVIDGAAAPAPPVISTPAPTTVAPATTAPAVATPKPASNPPPKPALAW